VTTSGALQTTAQGGSDAFAIHLDPTLSQLIYSTIIGGTGDETETASRWTLWVRLTSRAEPPQ
jgi:hypothetical protein